MSKTEQSMALQEKEGRNKLAAMAFRKNVAVKNGMQ